MPEGYRHPTSADRHQIKVRDGDDFGHGRKRLSDVMVRPDRPGFPVDGALPGAVVWSGKRQLTKNAAVFLEQG